jgi:hypothetical protein
MTTTLNFSAAADSFANALIDAGLLDTKSDSRLLASGSYIVAEDEQGDSMLVATKSYTIVEDEHGDSNVIFEHNGCEIKIIVSDYWMFPNEICYFVNVSHPNGNFMCQSGTNRVMRAAIDVGVAFHFANVSGDPIQSEDEDNTDNDYTGPW